MEQEKRVTEQAELSAGSPELAKDSPRTGKVISGYALKFGQPSKDLGGFVEVIVKGHNKMLVLGH